MHIKNFIHMNMHEQLAFSIYKWFLTQEDRYGTAQM